MELINLISEEEKVAIINRIKGCYPWGYNEKHGKMASFEHLFRHWNANKLGLHEMLGNKLTLSKTINYEKTETEICEGLDEMIIAFRKAFYQRQGKYSWMTPEEEMFDYSDRLFDLITDRAIAKNKYTGPTFSFISLKTGKKITINSGCKVIRTLGKLVDEFDLDHEMFERFRLKHSMALNDAYKNAELVLSIHPLDFMTMSDNNHNWESCMSWDNEGCYRQGTVEMMNSNCVVVAYIAGDNKTYKPGYGKDGLNWNSKRWRELFIITDDIITGVKGYPYWNRSIEAEVVEWIKELQEVNCGKTYNLRCEKFEAGERIPYVNTLTGEIIRHFRTNFSTDLMYNDFSAGYHYGWFNVDDEPTKTHLYVNYSGPSECMWCGGNFYDSDGDDDSYGLFCAECNGYDCRCHSCGGHGHEDDMYEVNGEMYCQYCYDDLPTCACCEGKFEYEENPVYVFHNEKRLDPYIKENTIWVNTPTTLSLCEDCLEKFVDLGIIKNYQKKTRYNWTIDRWGIEWTDMPTEFKYLFDEEEINLLIEKENYFEDEEWAIREDPNGLI